jgi:hypothetical protein
MQKRIDIFVQIFFITDPQALVSVLKVKKFNFLLKSGFWRPKPCGHDPSSPSFYPIVFLDDMGQSSE